jgi:hypothetical protein
MVRLDAPKEEVEMKIPEFTAETSLSPAMGHYQGNSISGSSSVIGALAMQTSPFAPGLMQNLVGGLHSGKQAHCCTPGLFGEPRCTYFTVPIWYQCDFIFTPYSCMVCRPGGVLLP